MAEIASAFISIIPETRNFGRTLNSQVGGSVRSSGTSLGKSFGKLFAVSAGVIAAAGIGNLLKGSIDEAREAQKVGAATEQIIKSTGGAAGITADQVGKMATRLSSVTGIDDEAIQSGSNLLLTFKNVKNYVDGQFTGTFDRATASAVDLSAAGFGSIESASKTLGKALNDPVKGVSALSRAGVTFSDQQKEQIKNFVETGDVAKAQNLILKEVEGQVGGVAAATATSGEKASVAFGNLKETIGTALLPVVDKAANLFTTKIAPAITNFITGLQNGSGSAGKFGDFLRGKVLPVLQDLGGFILDKVIPAFREGLGSALEGARSAFDRIRKAIADNKPELTQLLNAAKKAATFFYEKVIPVVGSLAGQAFKRLGTVIGGVIDVVGFLVRANDKYKGILEKVRSAVGSVSDKFSSFVGTVKSKAGDVLDKFASIRQGASRVKDVVVGAFNAISGAIQGAIDKAAALLEKLHLISREKGQGIKAGTSAGRTSVHRQGLDTGKVFAGGFARGVNDQKAAMVNAVSKAGDEVSKKLKEKLSKVRDALQATKSSFASLVEPIASKFTEGLFDFDTASAFTANLTTVRGTIQGLIGNFKTLIGEGLPTGFLYKLFQEGGPSLINSLAALPEADARAAASLFGDVTSLADQLGVGAATATKEGAQLLAEQKRQTALLDKIEKHLGSQPAKIAEATAQPSKRARRRAFVAA